MLIQFIVSPFTFIDNQLKGLFLTSFFFLFFILKTFYVAWQLCGYDDVLSNSSFSMRCHVEQDTSFLFALLNSAE